MVADLFTFKKSLKVAFSISNPKLYIVLTEISRKFIRSSKCGKVKLGMLLFKSCRLQSIGRGRSLSE